jgi:hypothetical protein
MEEEANTAAAGNPGRRRTTPAAKITKTGGLTYQRVFKIQVAFCGYIKDTEERINGDAPEDDETVFDDDGGAIAVNKYLAARSWRRRLPRVTMRTSALSVLKRLHAIRTSKIPILSMKRAECAHGIGFYVSEIVPWWLGEYMCDDDTTTDTSAANPSTRVPSRAKVVPVISHADAVSAVRKQATHWPCPKCGLR